MTTAEVLALLAGELPPTESAVSDALTPGTEALGDGARSADLLAAAIAALATAAGLAFGIRVGRGRGHRYR